MNNNSPVCVRCGHEFSRIECLMSCQGCDSRRCDACEPEYAKCKKTNCSGSYCEVCYEKKIGNQFCHKCNTQCWVCENIPYPPYPMEKRRVKDVTVVICARHSSHPNEMKVFEDFLTEFEKSEKTIDEQQLKEDLSNLNRRFQ